MAGRRDLLKAVFGLGAASASGMSPADVVKLANQPSLPVGFSPLIQGDCSQPCSSDDYDRTWGVLHKLRLTKEIKEEIHHRSRPDIDNMRSWSPAYKTHIKIKDELAWREALARIESDQDLRDKVFKLLGV
jgi:hypothetical protein